jgi:hypothetical protein
VPLSNSGNELLKLVSTTPSMDYLTYFAKSFINENVGVKYAHILAFQGNEISYKQPLQEFK